MFAFLKNNQRGKRLVVAGEVLRKAADKAMAIDYRLPWKEAGGKVQYGLNTADGVNMVVLMVHDTLCQNVGQAATTVDGRNAFNPASRQKLLDLVYATFPQLALFVETWYLTPSPLWFYMLDHTVGTILSREGVQKGDVIASFLFTLLYASQHLHTYAGNTRLYSTLCHIGRHHVHCSCEPRCNHVHYLHRQTGQN